uniref:NADH-ubiquinone oxidoreductase chain 4 n=1 Tax=Aguriahana triangularis TaxID=2893144 RepID=A0A9E6XT62_9HEMI|nr:NADH dehydrogenase subunit 4 [Aguriahana triangularis]UGN61337.1 NADH dehydrogenase subunit 4 [Aguriahana triangularis]
MMKLFIYTLFMIPYFFFNYSWNLFQFTILFLMLLFISFSGFSFFSMISYNYGVDYYSYGLIILSMLIISLMIISSNSIKNTYTKNFFLFINLILCLSLILVFSSMNMLIMYLFFEFSLIPLLVLVYTWGYQPERLISGLYLFFYTLFASLPFLLVIINLMSTDMSLYFDMEFFIPYSFFIHMFMFFAFMVKLPMYMVHFWLPKAHVQAPVSGSMILAGLLLKIGGYGFIRFMTLHELSFLNFNYIWFSFSLMGCILVSMICLIQGDVKCLIAYSSVAHMSMCLIGLLTMTKWGLLGSFLMMLSHGLCSSGLFCLANFSYERYSSRSFFLNKGLINLMPSMSLMWFLFCSFNMSCPPSLNFFSEVFIINSMIMYWSNSFFYFLFISFFSACFSYFLYSYLQHGLPHLFYCYSLGLVREFLLMFIHLVPLIILILSLNFFF